jgi:hypothetical protein
VFVSLCSSPDPLSLQLATKSPPVHQRHCTSSATLFIAAFTPPQFRLRAPRTRLNILLLALAPSLSTSLHPLSPLIYIPSPIHRGLSCASELRSFFFNTHSYSVRIYILNPTDRSHPGRGRAETPTGCTSASTSRSYVCASGMRAVDVRISPQATNWSSGVWRRSSLGFSIIRLDGNP